MYRSINTLSAFLADTLVPDGMLDAADFGSFFGNIHVLDFESRGNSDGETISSTMWLGFEDEVSIGFPGVDGARFVIGSPGVNFVTATLDRSRDSFSITLHSFRFTIRFGSGAIGGEGKPSELAYEGTLQLGSDLSITA